MRRPHSTWGCWTPSPIKDNPALTRIAYPASMDACMMIGLNMFGKICFIIIWKLDPPKHLDIKT